MTIPIFKIFIGIVNDPEKVRGLLKEVLRRREFRSLFDSPLKKKWVEFFSFILKSKTFKTIIKFLSKVKELLSNFFTSLFSSPQASFIATIVAVILFLVIICFLVITIKKKVSLNLGKDSLNKVKTLRDVVDDEKNARSCASKGLFVDAIRYLYSSLLKKMNKKGLIEFSQYKTNREALKIIRARTSPDFSSRFNNINRIFEEKVYALKDCSSVEFKNFDEIYKKCMEGVGLFD